MDIQEFFESASTPQQRLYEALRAVYVDKLSIQEVLKKYNISYVYFQKVKKETIDVLKEGGVPFFMVKKPGPKGRHTSDCTVKLIIDFRKKNHSIEDIKSHLHGMDIELSLDTIDRILKEEGFSPLPKRTQQERKSTFAAPFEIPKSKILENKDLQRETFTSIKGAVALVFVPLIEELGIIDAFKRAGFPSTSTIPRTSYLLSLLALKLIGMKRHCHDKSWNIDRGLGLFAGLNVLPKSSSLSSYSYRVSRSMNRKLLVEMARIFKESENELGDFNLDFKAIPHWGDLSQLPKNWCGSRGRAMKSILSLIVQDPDANLLSYTNAEIKQGEQNNAVLEFVDFWKEARGIHPNMLIFDSKFTTYENLSKLNQDGIKFITLRRRGKKLIKELVNISDDEWQEVQVEGKHRKHPKVRVHDSKISLRKYKGQVRQLIIINNGRKEPAFLITNDLKSSVKSIVRKYARRWLVEKEIAEQVEFFHLNGPSSSIVIKVDFDLTLSLLAHNLYRILTAKLSGFEQCTVATIFRNFLDTTAKIKIEKQNITILLEKKSHLPVLFETDWMNKETNISWLKSKVCFQIDTGS